MSIEEYLRSHGTREPYTSVAEAAIEAAVYAMLPVRDCTANGGGGMGGVGKKPRRPARGAAKESIYKLTTEWCAPPPSGVAPTPCNSGVSRGHLAPISHQAAPAWRPSTQPVRAPLPTRSPSAAQLGDEWSGTSALPPLKTLVPPLQQLEMPQASRTDIELQWRQWETHQRALHASREARRFAGRPWEAPPPTLNEVNSSYFYHKQTGKLSAWHGQQVDQARRSPLLRGREAIESVQASTIYSQPPSHYYSSQNALRRSYSQGGLSRSGSRLELGGTPSAVAAAPPSYLPERASPGADLRFPLTNRLPLSEVLSSAITGPADARTGGRSSGAGLARGDESLYPASLFPAPLDASPPMAPLVDIAKRVATATAAAAAQPKFAVHAHPDRGPLPTPAGLCASRQAPTMQAIQLQERRPGAAAVGHENGASIAPSPTAAEAEAEASLLPPSRSLPALMPSRQARFLT